MDWIAGMEAARGRMTGAVLALGNFDGVHLGHRQLCARALRLARQSGVRAGALTFWPHPSRTLAPQLVRPLITSRLRRRQLLMHTGLDLVIEQAFDQSFSTTTAERFEQLLLGGLRAGGIVVGHDFRYGQGRGGNVATLTAACVAAGIPIEVVPPVTLDGLVVSSTQIRELVLAGQVDAATRLLGRPFDLTGEVVRGAGRGRTIGVPTANIAVPPDDGQALLVPGIGVYAVQARLPDGRWVGGACNVGVNPTFRPEADVGPQAQELSVEVHLLGVSEDLYGKTLQVAFVQRLRAERRFASVDALVSQIQADIDSARQLLHGLPTPEAETPHGSVVDAGPPR